MKICEKKTSTAELRCYTRNQKKLEWIVSGEVLQHEDFWQKAIIFYDVK